jgi:hypothetical protein
MAESRVVSGNGESHFGDAQRRREARTRDSGLRRPEVDPETGHILKSTGRSEGVDFSTAYSDFRNVDGLLFAFREANSAQGMATGTNEISKVEISLRK